MLACQCGHPQVADTQHLAGAQDGTLLPGLHHRVVEPVQVVHRANEASNGAGVAQVGQCIAADAVVRMQHVEALHAQRARQVPNEGLSARGDHLGQPRRILAHGHQLERAARRAEHLLARQRRREHRHAVAARVQQTQSLGRARFELEA